MKKISQYLHKLWLFKLYKISALPIGSETRNGFEVYQEQFQNIYKFSWLFHGGFKSSLLLYRNSDWVQIHRENQLLKTLEISLPFYFSWKKKNNISSKFLSPWSLFSWINSLQRILFPFSPVEEWARTARNVGLVSWD